MERPPVLRGLSRRFAPVGLRLKYGADGIADGNTSDKRLLCGNACIDSPTPFELGSSVLLWVVSAQCIGRRFGRWLRQPWSKLPYYNSQRLRIACLRGCQARRIHNRHHARRWLNNVLDSSAPHVRFSCRARCGNPHSLKLPKKGKRDVETTQLFEENRTEAGE